MNPHLKYEIATVEHALANPLEYSLSRNIGENVCRIMRRNHMSHLTVREEDFFSICRAAEKALEELNTWTQPDANAAKETGWAIGNLTVGCPSLVSCNQEIFRTSTEANFHVFKKAQAGDKLALKALRILGLSL